MQTAPENAISFSAVRAIFSNSPLGVLLVSQGNSAILFANTTTEKMLGYPPSGLDGCPLAILLPASIKNHHAGLMSGFFANPQQRMMGSGRDLYARHWNGLEIPVEIALAPMTVEGEVCVIAYLTDLTERIKALKQREQLISAMPQGVLLTDASGIILMTNTALNEEFGYSSEELQGRHLELLLPERYRDVHIGHLSFYLANPSQRKMGTGRDLTGLHKSGVEFPIEIALSSLDFGGTKQVMAVVSDISVRKKAEHALLQTNAQLEEFTYVASHDLRSPLRGIADLLSWIKEDFPADALTPAVSGNFERIEIRIARCERMIDDLLDYARAGSKDSSLSMIDLLTLTSDILLNIATPPGFTIDLDIRSTPFLSSRVPLNVSITNLLSNAIKHHGQTTGKIRVRSRDEGRFAIIEVEDDGQGIPAGAAERIFKLFHRANATTEGHGVGLAVTRRMINANGGTIVVEPGKDLGGACFRIQWPRILMKEVHDE